VSGCAGIRPTLLGISILPPGTMGIPALVTLPPAGRQKDAFQHFNRYQKPNFRCMRDKKYIKIQLYS